MVGAWAALMGIAWMMTMPALGEHIFTLNVQIKSGFFSIALIDYFVKRHLLNVLKESSGTPE